MNGDKKNVNHYAELYDGFWGKAFSLGREDFGDVEFALTFLNKVKLLKKDHRILEIGCGIGKLCDNLYQDGYTKIIGTDISSASINFGKEKYPLLTLAAMDGAKLEFPDNYFDVCLSFDLIEHLPDINEHFKEVYRVLRPKGCYLFQTPNILSNSIIETWQGRGFRGFKKKELHPSLQFSWTLKRKLRKAGFTKVKFVRISPTSEYKLKQLPIFLRFMFKAIPWNYLPISLQIGFWCVAYKENVD